jgi:hypothetical protein
VSPATGNGDGSGTINVAENQTTAQRTATVTFTAGTLARTIAVTQADAAPVLTINPTAIDVANSAGTYAVAITSNTAWSATVSAGATWCTMSPATGTGNSTVTVNVVENATTVTRAATIAISSGTLSQTIDINQISSFMLIDPNAPRYAASNKAWMFGSQTWSDAIQIPECDVEYSRSSATEPICYHSPWVSPINFVYNFPYVNGY